MMVFNAIMLCFVLHIIWIFISVLFHIKEKETKPAIAKSILGVLCVCAVYYIFGVFNIVCLLAQ